MRSERLYLVDIDEAISTIGRWMDGRDESSFQQDELLQSAVLQKLSVIGEAAARLSADTWGRAPQVPWKEIIGFRNILIHGYDIVDDEIVWDIVEQYLPPLLVTVTQLLGTPQA